MQSAAATAADDPSASAPSARGLCDLGSGGDGVKTPGDPGLLAYCIFSVSAFSRIQPHSGAQLP